jgi:hypothetical protein
MFQKVIASSLGRDTVLERTRAHHMERMTRIMLTKLGTTQEIEKSKSDFRTRPTHTENKSSIFTRYIGKVKICPTEQLQVSLGIFGAERPEKGFSIALRPSPNPKTSITTEILSVGSSARHELFLVFENYGVKTVTAEIWGI